VAPDLRVARHGLAVQAEIVWLVEKSATVTSSVKAPSPTKAWSRGVRCQRWVRSMWRTMRWEPEAAPDRDRARRATRLGNAKRVSSLHAGKEMQQRNLRGARQGSGQLAIARMSGEHVAGWRGQNAQRPVEKGLLQRIGQSSEWLQGEERVDPLTGSCSRHRRARANPGSSASAPKKRKPSLGAAYRRWPMP